jgi:mono/diheme cytochrome c family protein
VYRLYAPHGSPAANVTVQASADQLTVASRRANGCSGCHSSTGAFPLDGGEENFLGGPMGTLVPPNLTPGGPLKDWTDGEIIRAIREGLDRSGHPLIIMPSDSFHNLSDVDVRALVAYLRSQPASDHSTAPRDLGIMALVLVGGGLFPTAEQPHIAQPQMAPPAGVTPAASTWSTSPAVACATVQLSRVVHQVASDRPPDRTCARWSRPGRKPRSSASSAPASIPTVAPSIPRICRGVTLARPTRTMSCVPSTHT